MGFINANKIIFSLWTPIFLFTQPKFYSLPRVYIDHFVEPCFKVMFTFKVISSVSQLKDLV